jgi:hypothetical protein
MNRDELIQLFCDIVNKGLAKREDYGKVAYEQVSATATKPGEKSLLDQLYQNYCQALQPHNFFNLKITEPDERFEQVYELLRLTFAEDELDPKEVLLDSFNAIKKEQAESFVYPIMIGRFWRTLGPQLYDASGRLQQFAFNPLVTTDNIIGASSGTYMSMEPSQRKYLSLGAIGHLVTRDHFRGGQGHGTALLKAFEQEVEGLAIERGDKLQLILLEAQADSRGFWAKEGYLWPVGSRYAQPPLEFDPVTGERFHDEVPEYLMVKIWNDPVATHIDSKLLTDAVRIMYQNWCLEKIATYTPEAAKRATDYVIGKVFAEFVASLPQGGEPVPLENPLTT